jgi:cytochrome c553
MKAISLLRVCSLAVLLAIPIPGVGQAQSPGPPWGWARGPVGAIGNFANGQRLASATCAACHGAQGNSSDPKIPKLAGQSAPYLYQQLIGFQSAVRRSAIMAPMTNPLSLADMADLASFYSRQSPQPDPVTDKQLAAAGERIFNGFASGPVPPCAMCHGSAGAGPVGGFGMMGGGMMGRPRGIADIPHLAGQHAAYVVAQLNQFETGERPSPIMERIAAMLSDPDKRAVAEYVAGLR